MTIDRLLKKTLEAKWNSGKIIIVTGPRQVGKTTLIRQLCEEEGNYLFINGDDSEDKLLLENAGENKLRNIIGGKKTVFVDEAQRIPNIGLLLKIIHDQIKDVRVIVSGSSALDLASATNESLTGRKLEYNLLPLSWTEMKNYFGFAQHFKNISNYLVFGSYPEIINDYENRIENLKELTNSYLYRDILQLSSIRKPETLDKLLIALALQLGNEVNYNELAQTVGIDRGTIEQYISLLEKTFIVFRLQPLARNVRNEINTSRKIYFYDNGIRNAIIRDFKPLELRQDVGALWENFLIVERMKSNIYNAKNVRSYFWRTYQQQEIDYIEEANGFFNAYEFKWNDKKQGRFSKTFLENYTVEKSHTITPKNCDGFLSDN